MPNDDSETGWVESISKNLGAIFRHILPGILIIGAANIAHPSWFPPLWSTWIVAFGSWQHIVVIVVVALTLGNTWFALNRYVVHQLVDYLMYLKKWEAPARTTDSWYGGFHNALGEHVRDSVCTPGIPPLARQHVSFRASSVLLLYIVAEIGLLASCSHEAGTLFDRYSCRTLLVSAVIFAAAVWQDKITRRIDHYVIEFGKMNPPNPRIINPN